MIEIFDPVNNCTDQFTTPPLHFRSLGNKWSSISPWKVIYSFQSEIDWHYYWMGIQL